MCTVSYYQNKDKIILTSNRDESSMRSNALPPQKIKLENTVLYCPIDPESNGTWFAVKNNGAVLVLLNGSATKHKSMPPYRKSRGLILLEIANAKNIISKWNDINLDRIEPFTLVVFHKGALHQLRWDAKHKTCDIMDAGMSHIWSSATLYSPEVKNKRKQWFEDFLQQSPAQIEEEDLLSFHTNTQKNDTDNGLVINRNQEMMTKSVTQCVLEKDRFSLHHFDLVDNTHIKISESIL